MHINLPNGATCYSKKVLHSCSLYSLQVLRVPQDAMEASCRRRSMTRRPILRRFESDVPFGKRSQIRLHRVGITGEVLRDVLDEKEVDELEF